MDNEAVIAIYDVRGIQDYIFRTNKVKEIVGASLIVDDLIIKQFKNTLKNIPNEEKIINWETTQELQFEKNNNIKVEILYYGGGNLVVLFRNKELARTISIDMSKNILISAYGLSLNYAYVKKTDNYQNDWENLKEKLSEIKATTPLNKPMGVLPIVQYDRVTGLPLSKQIEEKNRTIKVTYEAYQKINKYNFENDNDRKFIKEFDKMRANEQESLIAIVHIDGNSMGQNIRNLTEGVTQYSEATKLMREISCNIHRVFEEEAITAVIERIPEICKEHGVEDLIKSDGRLPFRPIISAGDDITFVCNSRISLDIVKEYLLTIKSGYMYGNKYPFSACAGIAIIHSHFPFHKAYQIAEECCQNAKKRAKAEGMVDGKIGNFVDFQYCYSASTVNIETTRENKYKNIENMSLIRRPYGIYSKVEKEKLTPEQRGFDIDYFEKTLNEVKNIARTKAKDLRDAYYETKALVDLRLIRLLAKGVELEESFDKNNIATYYDALEFLDIYAKCTEKEEE